MSVSIYLQRIDVMFFRAFSILRIRIETEIQWTLNVWIDLGGQQVVKSTRIKAATIGCWMAYRKI
jgi:hypothetical protein